MNYRSIVSMVGTAVGVIFIIAGVLHASEPWQFLDSIRNYRILPTEGAVYGRHYYSCIKHSDCGFF